MIKPSLRKKKFSKAKWLSEKVLKIAEKRREARGKKERKEIMRQKLIWRMNLKVPAKQFTNDFKFASQSNFQLRLNIQLN